MKIQKCRYLESSGCVGMCTNMCKLPTQRFFTDTFGALRVAACLRRTSPACRAALGCGGVQAGCAAWAV